MASTARARSSVSSRTTPPMASPTRTSRVAAARPGSRRSPPCAAGRESWPPISTPRAQPPKTTAIEPMSRARSRSSMTLALRSVKRVCRERSGRAAAAWPPRSSGAPSALSCTKVAAPLPALTFCRSSWVASGSLTLVPKPGRCAGGVVRPLRDQQPLQLHLARVVQHRDPGGVVHDQAQRQRHQRADQRDRDADLPAEPDPQLGRRSLMP